MKQSLKRVYTFRWLGITKQGSRIKGLTKIHSSEALVEQLKQQGIEPVSIKKCLRRFAIQTKRISKLDVAMFARNLANLVAASIPLVKSLDIIADADQKSSIGQLAKTLKIMISLGEPFSSVLRNYPKIFSQIFIGLIYVGEQSSTLDVMLNRVADYLEKSEVVKKRLKKACYYPILVITITMLIAASMLIYVVPQFENLFQSFNAELPYLTSAIIQLSRYSHHHSYLLLLTLTMISLVIFFSWKKSKRFRELLENLTLKIPLLGTIINKIIIVRLLMTLGTLLAAGIQLLPALTTVKATVTNSRYQKAITTMIEQVTIGQQLHVAMKLTSQFPQMMVQMIAVAEESGRIDEILSRIASIYEQEIDATLANLHTLLEPLVMLTLSMIIGIFVLAMYLPIFRLGSVI